MPITVESAGENWVLTPAPASPFEAPPRSVNQQQWMLTVTGVAILYDNGTQGVQGNLPDDWRRETVTIAPNISAILKPLIGEYSISAPAYTSLGLSVSQWAPYAAISSGFHNNTDDAGFAVDTWRPTPFTQGGRDGDGGVLNSIFAGIEVDIAVRNNKAWIYRVSYQITLVGLLAYLGDDE